MFFNKKSAVVSGGCSGIGLEIVKHFLQNGIESVAILDICDPKNISQSLQSEYDSQKVMFIQTDVSEKDQVKRAFDEILKEFGHIDYMIGSAGIVCESDYQRTINVNLIGIFHTTYTAIESMSKENGGRGGVILNVSSTAAFDVYSFMPSYSASKHGIVGLQRCLSDDHYYNKYGIKFITLCPGPTNTPIIVDIEKKINFGDVNGLKFQEPSFVAECVMDMLRSPVNGSIWIVEDNKMREVTTRMLRLHEYRIVWSRISRKLIMAIRMKMDVLSLLSPLPVIVFVDTMAQLTTVVCE